MMRVLDVPIVLQETNYECGNNALAAVLHYFGKPYSTAALAELANTRTVGTDHGDMIAAAVKTGATAVARSGGGEAALAEVVALIARGIPVIVGWWSRGPDDLDFDARWTLDERMARDCGHYSVVRGCTASTLQLMDPLTGYSEYTHGDWMRVWYDTDTDAYDLVTTWYLALEFDVGTATDDSLLRATAPAGSADF